MINTLSTNLTPLTVSIVVPVYNSEATLVELTRRINDVLTPLVRHFEIIIYKDNFKIPHQRR